MLESVLSKIAEENKIGNASPSQKKEQIQLMFEDILIPAWNRIRNRVSYTDILDRIKHLKNDAIQIHMFHIMELFHRENEHTVAILQTWREAALSYYEDVGITRNTRNTKTIRNIRNTNKVEKCKWGKRNTRKQ